ncbi:hypothetical protein [Aliamphritea spongicola]|nr:hypothetical protein [Aliamphritea spongicola]
MTFAATQSLCLGFWKSWLMPLADDLDVDMVHNLKSTTWMGVDFVEALSNNECDLVLCYWHPTIDFYSHWLMSVLNIFWCARNSWCR